MNQGLVRQINDIEWCTWTAAGGNDLVCMA